MSREVLSGERLTLAEFARAEAKREGEDTSVLHLARAPAARQPDEFDAVFGDGASKAIRSGRLTEAEAPSVEQVLESVPDAQVATVAARLHELLGDLPGWVSAPEAAASMGTPHTAAVDDARATEAHEPEENPLLEVVHADAAMPTHQATVAELLAQLSRRTPGNPLVIAPSGAGRTTLAAGLAAGLAADLPATLAGSRVVRLPIERLLSGEPLRNLNIALNALEDDDVAFIDDLEALLGLAGGGFFQQLALRLRGRARAARPARGRRDQVWGGRVLIPGCEVRITLIETPR